MKVSFKKSAILCIALLLMLLVSASAEELSIVPQVTVVYDSAVVAPGGDFIPARNGGVFDFTASCLDADSVRWSLDIETMSSMENGPFMPNNRGMAILKCCIKSVDENKTVIENVLEDTELMNPTQGQVILYGLEPGLYALGVEAVGAVDGFVTDEGEISATNGWQFYFFEIVEE